MNAQRKIAISRRWLIIGLAAMAILFAWAVALLGHDGPLSLPALGGFGAAAAQTPACAAAQRVIRAMLTVTDPRDPASWQERVDALSTAEGKTVWQSMLDQGWWSAVEAQQAITDQVAFEEVREVGGFAVGGQEGRKVRLTGTVKGRNKEGAFERPFRFQVLIVQDAAGEWRFAYFDLQVEQGAFNSYRKSK